MRRLRATSIAMDASDFNVQGPQDQNVQNAFPFVSATVAKDKAKLCVQRLNLNQIWVTVPRWISISNMIVTDGFLRPNNQYNSSNQQVQVYFCPFSHHAA